MSSSQPGIGWKTDKRIECVYSRGGREICDVSQTKDARAERSTHEDLNRRTVAKIQKKIIKQRKWNRLSRVLQAESDKDAIASWERDLHSLLLVFSVLSVGYIWR